MAMKKENQDYLAQKAGVNPPEASTVAKGVKSLEDLEKSSFGRFRRGAVAAKSAKSIIGMAAKNTFEFPVFVSSSVPLDYATATCSLLEQNYAAYLQIAIAQDPIVDQRAIKSGGYLAKFKTNTSKYVEYTDPTSMIYAHEASHNVVDTGDAVVEYDMISIEDSDAKLINESCSYEPLDEFSHFFTEADLPDKIKWDNFKKLYNTEMNPENYKKAQDEYAKYTKIWEDAKKAIRENNKDDNDREREIRKRQLEQLNREVENIEKYGDLDWEKKNLEFKKLQADIGGNDTSTAYGKEVHDRRRKLANDADLSESNKRKADLESKKLQADIGGDDTSTAYGKDVHNKRVKNKYDAQRAQLDVDQAKKDANRDEMRWGFEKVRNARENMVKAPELMDETKIRKLNTMKPFMMKAQIRVSNKGGTVSEYPVELILGVKVNCRVIDAEVLPDVAKYPLKEMNEVTNKIKWKAGELKFFRDVFMKIKDKKQSAIDSKDPKRRWYTRLYRLAHMKGDSLVSRFITGNNARGLMPNASIIITNNDVENVKAETGIDLLKGSVAKKLCNELFLMALVVIDQDAESVKLFLPDTHSDYEVHSIASINKQLAELDTAGTKTRDLFKLLG
jgi:hypothetical protein